MTDRPGRAIRAKALNFLSQQLNSNDRILVTGATGWLGRTLAYMLLELEVPSLFLASSAREETIGNRILRIEAPKHEVVSKFKPTVVIDFAFATREHLKNLGEARFAEINRGLIDFASDAIKLDSVRAGVLTSSGAAVVGAVKSDPKKDPYGFFKQQTEERAFNIATTLLKPLVLLRPFSLSGTLVPESKGFAFDSLIRQALKGSVEVLAKQRVLRRYVSVEDMLALGFAELGLGSKPVALVETGGELVDLVSLARRIGDKLSFEVQVNHQVDESLPPDNYFSDSLIWQDLVSKHYFVEETLDEQIERNIDHFSSACG